MPDIDAARLAALEEIARLARRYLDTYNLGEQLTKRTRDHDFLELERAVDRVIRPPQTFGGSMNVRW